MHTSKLRTVLLTGSLLLAGCAEESGTGTGTTGGTATGTATSTATGTASSSGTMSRSATAPATAPGAAGGDHPDAVSLGEKTVGGLQLKAMQDDVVKPGGEGAFDLKVIGPKPKAVRFWVGVESGEGSVKAKADEESPGNWHTHVEVPDPLPPGSKFWAEIEPQQGAKQTVSFDMKQ